MDNERQYINMLIQILEKQSNTLSEVLLITKEQTEIANADKFDEDMFANTLSKKDVLIIRLNELDDGFASLYDKVRKQVKNNPEGYKKDINTLQELIRRCTDLGNAIQTLEIRNRDKIAECFGNKRQEYSAKQTAATVVGKYNATMRNGLTGSGYRFNQDK
ncbi:MAG: hypothetical protein IJ661_05325 [Lachnospiraceae bacterium]|nr:hypothetical protein [Lachnospiraceae bacterium]